MRLLLLTVAALVATAAPAIATPPTVRASTLFVAPNGSDSGSGAIDDPLATVAAAVHRLPDGGEVDLRAGSYAERISLVGVHDLTVRAYADEHALLDGATLIPPANLTAMVEIANATNVTVSGLDIANYRTTRMNVVPAGIYIRGHDSGITITGNHVHDLGNDNRTLGSYDINAHGIAVYGDDPHGSITGLTIANNEVDHLTLGASETVVVNGNVDGWTIDHNFIHDNNNIGIDAIGYESTLTGQYRYTELNRARNGVISDNTVTTIRSKGNPSYWESPGWCNCADGIYVDGGTHIRIVNNVVSSNDIGVEVAAENKRGAADHVRVAGNHITGSLFTGITTGGYCNGARGCGGVDTGTSHDNVFVNNTLRGNNTLDDGSPELLVQYHSWANRFLRNDITATNSDHVVYGTVRNSDTAGHPEGNVSDNNTFAADGATAATAVFGWAGRNYTGFTRYQQATGQDAHSTFG